MHSVALITVHKSGKKCVSQNQKKLALYMELTGVYIDGGWDDIILLTQKLSVIPICKSMHKVEM